MVKRRFFLFLLVAAAAACSKDEVLAPADQNGDLTLSFGAGTSAADSDDGTRAGYDGVKSIWQANDALGVTFDADNKNLHFTQEAGSLSTDGTRVRYTGTLVKPLTGTVTGAAYYPYSASATVLGQSVTTTFPATQTYNAAGGYQGIPLFAGYTGDYRNVNFSFRNLFSVVKLTLSKSTALTSAVKLQSIVFQGNNNETVSGTMSVNMAGSTPSVAYSGTGKTTTLDCGSGVELTAAQKTFYIAVPAINYTKGYSFTFITDNGQLTKSAKNSGAAYAVNKIYKAPALAIDHLTIVTTIPDGALRTALQGLGLISILDGVLGTVSITAAGLLTTSINVSGKGITDLTGLDKFPLLVSLNASNNNLVSVDLSKLTLLTNLDLSKNQLTGLSLTANTKLLTLNVASNKLTALDVKPCLLLQNLNCSSNQITALDVTLNGALLSLDCSVNKLTALDASKCGLLTTVKCFDNVLTTLNISTLRLLTGLYLDASGTNSFSLLKFTVSAGATITNLVADNLLVAALWTTFVCSGNHTIKTISLKNNIGILGATVTNNPALTSLNVTGSTLSSLLIVRSGNASGFTVTGALL